MMMIRAEGGQQQSSGRERAASIPFQSSSDHHYLRTPGRAVVRGSRHIAEARRISFRNSSDSSMASVLLQERLLGFTLGVASGLGAFIYEQKYLWRSTGDVADTYSGGKLPPARIYVPEPIFGRRAQEQLIHAWNLGVDRTLGWIFWNEMVWLVVKPLVFAMFQPLFDNKRTSIDHNEIS